MPPTFMPEHTTCYLICAVQRTGSSFLTETLKSSGLAGVPEEFFLAFEEGRWAHEQGVTNRTDFLRRVFQKGRTPNGVFGAKLMWNTFQDPFQVKMRALPAYAPLADSALLDTVFQGPKYIWNRRRDKVRQAVSWTIAAQTGIYSSHQGEPEKPPVFDFAQIDALHRLAHEWEAGWDDFFRRANIRPFQIIYEDFLADFEATATALYAYLEIELPPTFTPQKPSALKKQSTSRNGEWAERYLALKQDLQDRQTPAG